MSTENIQNYYTTLNGDFLSPSQLSSIDEGESMIKALNYMNIDYVCFGNHEFDIPKKSLSNRITEFDGKWLSTNILEFNDTMRYSISNQGGIKIAWLGICMDNLEDYTRYPVKVNNFIDSTKQTIQQIKNKHNDVDIFIAMTHQDYDKDVELVKRIPDINLVLGGHEHYPIIQLINNTNIIKVGMDANSVAKIKIKKINNKVNITYDILHLIDFPHLQPHKKLTDYIYDLNGLIRNIDNKNIFTLHNFTSTRNIRSNANKIYLCQKILSVIKKYLVPPRFEPKD